MSRDHWAALAGAGIPRRGRLGSSGEEPRRGPSPVEKALEQPACGRRPRPARSRGLGAPRSLRGTAGPHERPGQPRVPDREERGRGREEPAGGGGAPAEGRRGGHGCGRGERRGGCGRGESSCRQRSPAPAPRPRRGERSWDAKPGRGLGGPLRGGARPALPRAGRCGGTSLPVGPVRPPGRPGRSRRHKCPRSVQGTRSSDVILPRERETHRGRRQDCWAAPRCPARAPALGAVSPRRASVRAPSLRPCCELPGNQRAGRREPRLPSGGSRRPPRSGGEDRTRIACGTGGRARGPALQRGCGRRQGALLRRGRRQDGRGLWARAPAGGAGRACALRLRPAGAAGTSDGSVRPAGPGAAAAPAAAAWKMWRPVSSPHGAPRRPLPQAPSHPVRNPRATPEGPRQGPQGCWGRASFAAVGARVLHGGKPGTALGPLGATGGTPRRERAPGAATGTCPRGRPAAPLSGAHVRLGPPAAWCCAAAAGRAPAPASPRRPAAPLASRGADPRRAALSGAEGCGPRGRRSLPSRAFPGFPARPWAALPALESAAPLAVLFLGRASRVACAVRRPLFKPAVLGAQRGSVG